MGSWLLRMAVGEHKQPKFSTLKYTRILKFEYLYQKSTKINKTQHKIKRAQRSLQKTINGPLSPKNGAWGTRLTKGFLTKNIKIYFNYNFAKHKPKLTNNTPK